MEQSQPRPPITPEQRRQRSESRKINTNKAFFDSLRRLCDLPQEELEKAAVSVVCALERRLTGDEVFDFESQLPAKFRDMLTRCERHEGAPPSKFGLAELYKMVGDDLGKSQDEVVGIVRATILALKGQITQGEADDVASQLPGDIKEIWIYP
jgi:uncharacterized protein (DUF2267 family)